MISTVCFALLLAADRPFEQSVEGVRVRVLALSDGAGQVWNPNGGPLDSAVDGWSPRRAAPTFPRGPHKNGLFLIEVSADDVAAVNVTATISGARMTGTGNVQTASKSTKRKLYQVRGVFPEALETTTLEILVGSGDWRNEGAVTVRKNSLGSYNGAILDGGRHGNFILQPAGIVDGISMTAAVSLAMGDSEPIAEDYRLIALDEDDNIIAETHSGSAAGYHRLYLLDCPHGPDKPKPAKFVFQQRPKNALTFADVELKTSPPK